MRRYSASTVIVLLLLLLMLLLTLLSSSHRHRIIHVIHVTSHKFVKASVAKRKIVNSRNFWFFEGTQLLPRNSFFIYVLYATGGNVRPDSCSKLPKLNSSVRERSFLVWGQILLCGLCRTPGRKPGFHEVTAEAADKSLHGFFGVLVSPTDSSVQSRHTVYSLWMFVWLYRIFCDQTCPRPPGRSPICLVWCSSCMFAYYWIWPCSESKKFGILCQRLNNINNCQFRCSTHGLDFFHLHLL